MTELKTLLKEYDAREAKYYAARNLSEVAYEAVNKCDNETTLADWDAATDALEEAEASLDEIDEQIARSVWGPAVAHHIQAAGGLSNEAIAYWEAEHQRALKSRTE